ncbi:hypothetical protein GCM10012284_36670 [Mangrovihabitans endophyticus]|uniref:Arginase n=1 Tax=Mangrovihabitans endophyticus TaxID=1751298 RepID=A0A8J3C281_9ACTN|nr:hypothetical protein GCM10012284_36670 [Mangrovihabitans endophyticus]
MRRIAILDAPTNLGLRPPTATSVPGCAKAPGALRDHGLLQRLQARDAGCLTPPRYDPGDWRPGDGVCHAAEIAAYSRALAGRIAAIIDAGEFPVVLGGDCSVLLGSGLAMNRLGDEIGGRIGLVFVDGHSDFRHPGNASYVGAAAGEDLALATGRGQSDLAAIEGRRPYFRDIDVVVLGIRAQDEYRLDLQAAGIVTRPVPTLRVEGAARSAQWARDQLADCAGYWVHVDVDVLDPAVMPAVDAPDPGGIAFPELELLLAGLVDTPHCLGVEVTVFDPDYDPDGGYAEEIASTVVAGLAPVRTVDARPDLVAARRELAEPDPQPAVAETPEATDPDADADAMLADAMPADGSESPGTPDETTAPAAPALGVVAHDDDITADNDDITADNEAAADDGAADDGAADDGAADDGAADDGAAAANEPAAGLEEAPDHGDAADEISAREPMAADDEIAAHEPITTDDSTVTDDSAAEGPGATDDVAADIDVTTDDVPADDVPADDVAADLVVAEVGATSDGSGDDPAVAAETGRTETHRHARPLGLAPTLDSEPLPATRPGMLRPRSTDSFSLPAQRPAFDIGPDEEPADLA